MRKFLAAALIVFFISGAAATTIESEELIIDLENSEAEANIKVADLTASQFTYITSADVRSVQASTTPEGDLQCKVQDLTLGDEIVCDTELRENFTINIDYTFDSLVSNQDQIKTFRYTHPIYRPTKEFKLRVKLPHGTGLAQENGQASFSPTDGSTGSDGRRIYVEWEKKPQLGETLSFRVDYENLNAGFDYAKVVAGVVLILISAGLIYLLWRHRNKEKLEKVYGDISEDEKDVLELLRENDGEMLQKDVVNSSDYSKAKISGLVSELVDKEIVEKEKEGRSNKLKIAKKYRY